VTITERVQQDVTAAAKAQDQQRLSALRLILDSLRKEAKEARSYLPESDEIAVLKRERKRRVEAADAYRKGGRDEAAEREESEAALIDAYLPEQISEEELEVAVAEALGETGARSPREMGKVMSTVMKKVGDRADGKRVSELVRSRLVALADGAVSEG
jgi:uncharacterized protein YqeY